MIELPQYEYETRLYPLVPQEHRWVFNKLAVTERCGIECGPCGMIPPRSGPWCLRPIMSLHGCGKGGWIKATACERGIMTYKAGWFWMPWYEGRHLWTEYINDIPIRQAGGFMDGNILKWERSFDFIQQPEAMCNISRYSVQESIDGNLVEWAPKHLADNKDYLYDMRLIKDENGRPLWEEMWDTARPW